MSKASEWAARWTEVMDRHPGEYATAEEREYIGPKLEFAPPGANWCAMVLPDGTLALASPERDGISGLFRRLTVEEDRDLNAWILDVFDLEPPRLAFGYRREWDPRHR